MKRAVVYFSETNNTKGAAEVLASELGADLIRIEMVKPLPTGKGGKMFMGGMQSTLGKTPEIKGVPENIEAYDEIILGTPVWAGKPASPIKTLLTEHKNADKIVAVFTFSSGGDNAKCIAAIGAKNLRATAAFTDRHRVPVEETMEKVKAFAAEI